MTLYIILGIACILNSAMNSIDHNKGSKGLYELWHILKNIFVGIFVVTLIIKFGKPYYVIPVVGICWMVLWELCYRIFNRAGLYRLDNKFRCKIIRIIYSFNRED